MSIDITALERPTQTWAQFTRSLSPGKAPALTDIHHRWEQVQLIERRDDAGKVVATDRRSLENGEQRAYTAWAAGVMEPEEERYFSMLSLRTDALVLQAIVPIVRELLRRDARNAAIIADLVRRVEAMESAQ